jgi:hypothetical protein
MNDIMILSAILWGIQTGLFLLIFFLTEGENVDDKKGFWVWFIPYYWAYFTVIKIKENFKELD